MGTYTTQDLENQLTRISNAVAACRTAIYNRGVNIPADAKFADLATYAAMIQCSHPDILLEYIQAGDGSDTSQRAAVYFNTGLNSDASTTFETVCSRPVTGSSNMLFGSNSFFTILYYNDKLFWYRNSAANVDWKVGSTPGTYGNMTYISSSIEGTTLTLNVDGSTFTTTTGSASYTQNSIYLFARHTSDSDIAWTANSGSRIKYIKFYSNNMLVRFYVPVLHYTNNQYVPCFYDKVNDTYIYNLGPGDVTYASTGDYLLDYIGAQDETAIPVTSSTDIRYATGVTADATIQVDTKFRLLWGSENYIYGSGTDGTTTPSWQTFGICYPGSSQYIRLSFGARSTSVNVTDLSGIDASTATASSLFFENGYGRCYLNGIKYSNANQSTLFSSNGIDLFSRHGNSQDVPVRNGARIYYCAISKANVVQKTYVPVLHNDSPYFLDLNTGNYLSHDGTGTPTYSLLD